MNITRLRKEIGLLVHSSDGYSDAWHPFFTLLFRHWPDIPFPVYLCSETKTYPFGNVYTINTGVKEWSERLFMALNRLPTKYVMLLLEDYLPHRKVDTQWILELVKVMEESGAGCMRLFPSPPPDIRCKNLRGVGIIRKGSEYRVSTQATVWNKSVLQELLLPEETVWQFEKNGSIRSNELPHLFLSILPESTSVRVEKQILPYSYIFTGIIRGRWTREAITLCRKENIELDLKHRKARPAWDPWFQAIYRNSPEILRHALDFIYSRLVPSFSPKA